MQKIRQEKERKVQNTAEMHQSAASVPDNLSIKLDGQGEDLMILSAQSGEVCLGVVSQQQEEILPGEILLKSSGGASIRLCNDGTILLNGKKVE